VVVVAPAEAEAAVAVAAVAEEEAAVAAAVAAAEEVAAEGAARTNRVPRVNRSPTSRAAAWATNRRSNC
jgi:hypothetical protein